MACRRERLPGPQHYYALAAQQAVSLQALDGRCGRSSKWWRFVGAGAPRPFFSTWGMPMDPLAAPPSRVVRTEGDGRAASGREMKGLIHDFVSPSCTSGKKGTRAERGCEPRIALRKPIIQSREGSGLGSMLTSSLILTAARASMAVSSGSGRAVGDNTRGGGSPTAPSSRGRKPIPRCCDRHPIIRIC